MAFKDKEKEKVHGQELTAGLLRRAVAMGKKARRRRIMVARLPTAARNAIPNEKDIQSRFYVDLIKLFKLRTGLRRGGCGQPRYRHG